MFSVLEALFILLSEIILFKWDQRHLYLWYFSLTNEVLYPSIFLIHSFKFLYNFPQEKCSYLFLCWWLFPMFPVYFCFILFFATNQNIIKYPSTVMLIFLRDRILKMRFLSVCMCIKCYLIFTLIFIVLTSLKMVSHVRWPFE